MSVGGVGAAGGSAGAGAAAGGVGAAGGCGGSSPGGASGVGGVTPSGGEGTSTKDISDAGDKAGTTYNIEQTQNNNIYVNMSSQDSVELHNCVHGPQKAADCNNIDLQKLIEMMIAIKLLEAMNDSGGSGGGFSTVA